MAVADRGPTTTSSRVLGPARTALVTGASRGIGKAVAIGLAEAGLQVALVATDAAKLERVAAKITEAADSTGSEGSAVAIAADVSDPDGVISAVEAAKQALGPIDLLVNAAGVIDDEVAAWEADPDQWWRTFEVNVR